MQWKLKNMYESVETFQTLQLFSDFKAGVQ